jgi:Na+/melibiose symporter-like transporter
MSIELILAAGIISFLLMYFAKAIEKEEGHFLLRYLAYSLAIVLFILIAKGAIDAKNVCEPVINQTELVGNTTSYTYGTYCYNKTSSTSASLLYKIANWVFILYLAYVMLFLIYWLFMKVQSFWRKR